jgi:hypothetical protein
MRAGALRHVVTWQIAAISGLDGWGNPSYTWTSQSPTLRCRVEPITSRKYWRNTHFAADTTHGIYLRGDGNINTVAITQKDRFLWYSTPYNVNAPPRFVDHDELGTVLLVEVKVVD